MKAATRCGLVGLAAVMWWMPVGGDHPEAGVGSVSVDPTLHPSSATPESTANLPVRTQYQQEVLLSTPRVNRTTP